ncbi:hypothetical protein COU54_04965 [Candidatus Pacearchaeota archaeon CG10_big_fil_rev_8_21_14_0_10_31_24]|nr:MAG: hypothetical protein COU54_04965 [Candidatus Pacearchaeota archaeon CG10_big_fil_rev_8_21_14_0_10_31_24]
MAKKTKIWDVDIANENGTFSFLFGKFADDKVDYNLEGLTSLRQLLSNEKAKILHTIKTKNPKSIYELSKILKRDFKSVSLDIRLLERFGLIEMSSEKTGKRERHKPSLTTNHIQINLNI